MTNSNRKPIDAHLYLSNIDGENRLVISFPYDDAIEDEVFTLSDESTQVLVTTLRDVIAYETYRQMSEEEKERVMVEAIQRLLGGFNV